MEALITDRLLNVEGFRKVEMLMFGYYISSQKSGHPNITCHGCPVRRIKISMKDNTSGSTAIRRVEWSAHWRVARAQYDSEVGG